MTNHRRQTIDAVPEGISQEFVDLLEVRRLHGAVCYRSYAFLRLILVRTETAQASAKLRHDSMEEDVLGQRMMLPDVRHEIHPWRARIPVNCEHQLGLNCCRAGYKREERILVRSCPNSV